MPGISSRDKIKRSVNALLETAKLLQTLLDCQDTSQQEVAKQMNVSPQALSKYLNEGFRPYIRKQMLSLSDLEKAYRMTRTPADRLLIDVFGMHDKDRDAVVMLPEYDEDALWDIVFNRLRPRERFVVLYMSGETDGEPKSMSETARQLCLTTERVRQIHAKAMLRLRNPNWLKQIFPAMECALPEYQALMTRQAQDAIQMAEKAKKQYELRHQMEELAESYDKDDPLDIDSEDECPEETPLDDIGLSLRPYNALYRAGVRTLEQLAEMDAGDILQIRHLGRHSANEIYQILKDRLGIEKPALKMT